LRGRRINVTKHASGTFDVQVNPAAPSDEAEGITLGRMSLGKRFHGELDATSQGQMLTAATEGNGSGAYVAIERVTGILSGRSGSFVLMHSGTMTRDGQHLSVTVAPGSGTGQLVGLAGQMAITIVDTQHRYDFAYTQG
jgi:Protein of unknown function (DUF3224)